MTFFARFKLYIAIYVFFSLLVGYWDIRLSDSLLYYGQLARVHFYRTLQAHFFLGALFALFFSLFKTDSREKTIPIQMALALSLFTFLIFAIKIHLVWLQTHWTDPEGLFWTALLIVGCFLLFCLVRAISATTLKMPAYRRWIPLLFVIITTFTITDAYIQRRPPDPPSRKAPNILLIVIDTLRADHLSPKISPFLIEFSKQGVVYQDAISSSPWTTPSHATLFSGQTPSKNGVDGRNIILDPASPTLAETLAQNGYQTAGFTNNVYLRKQTGLSRGFHVYEEFWGRNEGSSLMLLIEQIKDFLFPRMDTGAAETNKGVKDWLQLDWSGKNPFFLFVHYMEPHAPYGIPENYLKDFLPSDVTIDQANKINQDPELFICGLLPMSARDFQILKALYNNDIRYLDDRIRELILLLQQKNLLDNTLVIITSDHGEHFGDHRLMSHELSLYDALIRVPLILRYPPLLSGGQIIPQVVGLIDIFPTILEVTKIQKRLPLQGRSILPSRLTDDRPVFAEYDNARAIDKIQRRFPNLKPDPLYQRKTLKAVRFQQWKFIWGSDGTRELYDVKIDPQETNNLLPQYPQVAQDLELILSKWLSSFQSSRFYRQEETSREALEELRSLGYIN